MALPSHIAAGAEIAVDVAVVGSGVAGLVTALDLLDRRPELTVALIDKGVSGESGSTPLAQGGLARHLRGRRSPSSYFCHLDIRFSISSFERSVLGKARQGNSTYPSKMYRRRSQRSNIL